MLNAIVAGVALWIGNAVLFQAGHDHRRADRARRRAAAARRSAAARRTRRSCSRSPRSARCGGCARARPGARRGARSAAIPRPRASVGISVGRVQILGDDRRRARSRGSRRANFVLGHKHAFEEGLGARHRVRWASSVALLGRVHPVGVAIAALAARRSCRRAGSRSRDLVPEGADRDAAGRRRRSRSRRGPWVRRRARGGGARVIDDAVLARVRRAGDAHRGAATCSRRSAARSPSARGVIDLALEAKLLFGAFAAAAVGHATGSADVGDRRRRCRGRWLVAARPGRAARCGSSADQVIVGDRAQHRSRSAARGSCSQLALSRGRELAAGAGVRRRGRSAIRSCGCAVARGGRGAVRGAPHALGPAAARGRRSSRRARRGRRVARAARGSRRCSSAARSPARAARSCRSRSAASSPTCRAAAATSRSRW